MKQQLLDIIANDASYNKSATRYLRRTHSELWSSIVAVTSFLPDTSLPKQRVWHVLNDVYERPICPITGEYLKWNEKQYFSTANRRAKQLLKHRNGDYKNGHTPEANAKRKASNLKKVAQGRRYRDKNTYTEDQRLKAKQTCLEKYGVENGSQSLQGRKKNSEAQIKNGATPKNLRPLRRFYYEAVKKFTEESWSNHFDKINPDRVNRSKTHDVDHIYSIQQGFRDNIPAYIIGHWTNLRMLPKPENYSKGMRCDKTQEQLFEDFFNRIS